MTNNLHLGGTTAALVRPAAVQGVSASGHILPDAGWEVADDEGTYFTLLPRKEAMARLDPAWHHQEADAVIVPSNEETLTL